MKKLILVRHAHALSGFEARVNTDALRPLSETGRQQAANSASTLQKQEIHPDIIFTSPFLRAVQTAEILSGFLGAPIQEESLLNGFATDENVIAFLNEQLHTYNTVLAVTHNPSITYITRALCGQMCSFSPACFAILNRDEQPPKLIYFGE
jgi:phosphohistidine phosphatase